ncbi:GDSL-type esterase/lipase family protein [Actinoalloteichus spitiensis]|uniref:GDSL-type esterase/lipase family protein n=1 Tax=Actinoalloteichus spitiensis TaxID=252394 RepID=UPI0003630B36|nr:GDSL-type esterase/lipase family protein [Actinoalloteichus spitiensis]
MRSPAPLRPLSLFLVLLMIALPLLLVVSDRPLPVLPEPPWDAPGVVVALGDSTMSGEGAGHYELGTDGEDDNWCHRSSHATVHHLRLPGVDRTVNLACSGARAEHVGLGDAVHNTEGSQAEQLRDLAGEYRVAAIVVAVGANDDPRFSDVLGHCVRAWFEQDGGHCGETLSPSWEDRVAAMTPKVRAALADIRQVMREHGYPDASYEFVLQSYASPIGTRVIPGLRGLAGCPFRESDTSWMQQDAVRALADGLAGVARQAEVRFLDLSQAGLDREACSRDDGEEWFTRLTIDWEGLGDDHRAPHAIQESFHPNAAGHAEFGRCLTDFLADTARSAACVAGPDGRLTVVPDDRVVDDR